MRAHFAAIGLFSQKRYKSIEWQQFYTYIRNYLRVYATSLSQHIPVTFTEVNNTLKIKMRSEISNCALNKILKLGIELFTRIFKKIEFVKILIMIRLCCHQLLAHQLA